MEPISSNSLSSHKHPKSFNFSPKTIFLISSCVMEFLLALNIIWSCSSTFPCPSFLPTLSYLSCYRGHDRLFTFTMTYWSIVLLIFNAIAYLHFKSQSKLFNNLFIFSGTVVCVLTPCIAVIDEANTSYYAKIEKIHAGMMIGFTLTIIFWVYLTGISGKVGVGVRRYVNFMMVCGVWSFAQWFYSEHGSLVFNYRVEAVSEWIVVSLAVFCPVVYASEFDRTNIKTSKRKD